MLSLQESQALIEPSSYRRVIAVLTCIVFAVVAGVSCARPQVADEPPSAAPQTSPGPHIPAPVKLVDADAATAIAPAGDGRIFFAERGGRIRIASGREASTFAELDVSDSGERGLLGLALAPRYPEAPFVYALISPKGNERVSRVIRLTDRGGRGVEQKTLVELPAGDGCCHKGGRIKFGQDGQLYVSVGDNQSPSAAKREGDLRGKILRYTADGDSAPGNPFGDANPVWAIGLRNVFGFTFGEDGSIWATENGPSGNDGPRCCDEVNLIVRGGNYGWPDTYGNRSGASGTRPVWTSGNEVVAPTGIALITSDRIQSLRGAIAFCSYEMNQMIVIDTDGRPWSSGLDEAGRGPSGCMYDVAQGPNGQVYFSGETALYQLG